MSEEQDLQQTQENPGDPGNFDIDHQEVARLAYSYWEARGGQGGSPEEDWFRAESELKARRASAAT